VIDAAFAAATTRGPLVVRITDGHPVAIAEAAVVAHLCSGGRLELVIEDPELAAAVAEALTRVTPRAPGLRLST